jgi:plasmid stabilization system protein ParE
VAQVLDMPQAGAPKILRNVALESLRSRPVEGFEDMRLYYLVRGEDLRVVRVLHGRRDIDRILENEPADDPLPTRLAPAVNRP